MKKFKKSLSLLAALMVGIFLISGCGSRDNNQGGTPITTIIIAGSTSVQPISDVLAEEYAAINSNVKIEIQGGGSSQGVRAIQESVADIGALSRSLSDSERSDTLIINEIALDGVAIVVHPDNTDITNLSMQQVQDIYAGLITNWSEVGGQDALITVVSREEGSGTREAFTSIVMGSAAIIDDVVIQNANGAVRVTVAGDPNAIGYLSLAMLNDQIRGVNIDGIAPTEENVKNKSYVLQRPFIYLIPQNAPEAVQDFLAYVMSEDGQKIVEEMGAISAIY